MKIRNLYPAVVTSLIILLAATGIRNQAFSQNTPPVMKIGTYDSRVVVYAYSRSDLFTENLKKLRAESEAMFKDTDSIKRNEGAYKMITYQYLNHQMVFCAGSAASVLELVRDKLPALASKAGVGIIVSQWELNFSDPSIEVVDLTMEVSSLFEPKEDIGKMVEEFRKQDPIPLMDLTVEEVIGFWKQYESGQKR